MTSLTYKREVVIAKQLVERRRRVVSVLKGRKVELAQRRHDLEQMRRRLALEGVKSSGTRDATVPESAAVRAMLRRRLFGEIEKRRRAGDFVADARKKADDVRTVTVFDARTTVYQRLDPPTFRVLKNTTFGELAVEARRYFDASKSSSVRDKLATVAPLKITSNIAKCMLVDEAGASWISSALVTDAFDPLHVPRIFYVETIAPERAHMRAWKPAQLVKWHAQRGQREGDAEQIFTTRLEMLDSMDSMFRPIQSYFDMRSVDMFIYDLVVTIAFGVLYTTILFWRNPQINGYSFTQSLQNGLTKARFGAYEELSFKDIASSTDYYAWMRGPLKRFLFQEVQYNGARTIAKGSYIDDVTQWVGPARFWQTRVTPNSCGLRATLPESITTKFPTCWGPFGPSTMEREPTLRINKYDGMPDYYDSSGNNYSFGEYDFQESSSTFVGGYLGDYYGSGYFTELPQFKDSKNATRSPNDFLAVINRLEATGFIDPGTRVVATRLNFFNANYNIFTTASLIAEFGWQNSVVTSSRFEHIRYELGDTPKDLAKILVEWLVGAPLVGLMVYIQLGYYADARNDIKRQCVEREKQQMATPMGHLLPPPSTLGTFIRIYVFNPFVICDYMIFTLYFCNIVFRMTLYGIAPLSVWTLRTSESYFEIGEHARLYRIALKFDGIIIFCLIIKLAKFMRVLPVLRSILGAVMESALMVATLGLVLMVILWGFTTWAMEIFGSKLYEFSFFFRAQKELLLGLFGTLKYQEMREADYFWAPIFVTCYIPFMSFTLVSAMLAITVRFYARVRQKRLAEAKALAKKFAAGDERYQDQALTCDDIMKERFSGLAAAWESVMSRAGEVQPLFKRFRQADSLEARMNQAKLDFEAEKKASEEDANG